MAFPGPSCPKMTFVALLIVFKLRRAKGLTKTHFVDFANCRVRKAFCVSRRKAFDTNSCQCRSPSSEHQEPNCQAKTGHNCAPLTAIDALSVGEGMIKCGSARITKFRGRATAATSWETGSHSVMSATTSRAPSAEAVNKIASRVAGRFQKLTRNYASTTAIRKYCFDSRGNMALPLRRR